MSNHSNFRKPGGCQGCFIFMLSVLLIAGAAGYYGYLKIFHKEQFEIAQIDYPPDQLRFLDALVAQKLLLNENNGVEWAAGLNDIRKKEVQAEREKRYYDQWDQIIKNTEQMPKWLGIISSIRVIPGGNRDAGRIEFQIVCPIQRPSGKYKAILTTESTYDKASNVGMKLRDMHVGELVTFNARLNGSRYQYTKATNLVQRRDLYDPITKGDERFDSMCRFTVVITEDVELLESRKIEVAPGKGSGLW